MSTFYKHLYKAIRTPINVVIKLDHKNQDIKEKNNQNLNMKVLKQVRW